MMDPEDRQALRDAALGAVNGARTRADVHSVAREADWELQTSNSFRRIGTRYGDGNVLCGTKQHDGHPDLLAAPGVLDYIVSAQPRVVLQLLMDVDVMEDKHVAVQILCNSVAAKVAALGGILAKLGNDDPQAQSEAFQIVDQINVALRGACR
jgi:hypothetical protein